MNVSQDWYGLQLISIDITNLHLEDVNKKMWIEKVEIKKYLL